VRSGAVRLSGRLLPLLEIESGTNDRMAIFLTIGLTETGFSPLQAAVPLGRAVRRLSALAPVPRPFAGSACL
jgi:hypothetical protein